MLQMLSQDFLHFETGKVRLSVIDDTNSVVEHNSNARQTTDGAERSQAPEPKKLRTSRLELPHKNKSFLSGSRASLASRSEAPWSTLSGAVTKKRHSAGLLQNDQMQYHGARRLQPPQAVSPVLLARSDNDASRLNDADIMVHDNAKSRAEQWLKPSEFKCFSVFPEIEGMGYHGGGSTASASVISLGVSVRYALAPYDLSKIITFLPRYLIFSQLPFLALVKDAKASSLLPVGTRMYQKVTAVRRNPLDTFLPILPRFMMLVITIMFLMFLSHSTECTYTTSRRMSPVSYPRKSLLS